MTYDTDLRNSFGLKLSLAVLAGISAYFLTVQELKTELVGKADNATVTAIENKLARLEANEREYRMTSHEFREFRNDVIARLSRIESLLEDSGGKQ